MCYLLLSVFHQVEKYAGDRSHEDMKEFTVRLLGEPAGEQQKQAENEPQAPVVILTADNFENAIEQGYTFVKFFAPW